MADSARAARTSSLRLDAILEAVAFAAERLLLTPDWRDAADEALARMGAAAGVSRAYIIENHYDEGGRLLGSMRHEWCAPGISGQWDNLSLREAPWDDLPRWAELHGAGEPVITTIADLPAHERPEFEAQGTLAIAEHPVSSRGRWWGAIGFDDCATPRDWGSAEVQALRATATLLGAAITRQQIEEERLRAEDRWGHVVALIPAVTYSDEPRPDGSVQMGFVSPQIERVLGFPPERFTEDPDFWFSLIHPDDGERLSSAGAFDINDTEPFDQEYRMRAADGSLRWVHDTSTAVFRDDGTVDHFLGFMTDITERREAELRLREAEARHRALVERIPAIVYAEAIDAEAGDLYLSPQVESILGFTPEQWQGTRNFWKDHLHPDDLARVIQANDHANTTGETFVDEYRFMAKDGSYRWLRDEAVRVVNDEGQPLFWQGVLLDITERKNAEEQLRDAELKFRTIVEQNQAVFYTQDIDPNDPSVSKTTYIAPGNTEMLGYTLEDVMGDPTLWRSIIHADDRERVYEADAASNADGGDRFSMEYRMIARDGRIVWVQDEATLVRLPGKRPYWQGFLLDVTERKEAETRLERALDVEREASQRLRALDEMKNTFLQAVSHDLRTPLAAILGLAITLERGDVHLEESDAKDLAHRIAGNARRLDRMVMNLLDLDRLARGIVAPKLEEADVAAVVRRVLEESALITEARLHTNLRPVVQPVDVAKVERIVENLLANTVRHTPSNASIWVRVTPEPDGALITVEDSGAGVPTEIRDVIFEPFRQGPEAPQHSPGVGVGLALVRRFAELHGGRAWVQDRTGGGASFRVFLPANGPSGLLPPDDGPSVASPGLLPPAGLPDVS